MNPKLKYKTVKFLMQDNSNINLVKNLKLDANKT